MLQFIGYNFCADGDALRNSLGDIKDINKIHLTNAIFDHLNITKNINTPFTTEIPEIWDYDTMLNADFNGKLDAGNIEGVLSQITSVKIKRRIKGEFNWITLMEKEVKTIEDLTFIIEDKFNANNIEYEYAFIPVLNSIEGNYTITSVMSNFRGVFLSDADTIFRFLYEVNYSSNQAVQKVGTFEPFGNKYPILIANGNLNYQTGSVSGLVVNDGFEKNGKIDRKGALTRKDKLIQFLNNHKAKVLKDWNGSIWLVGVTGSPQISYKNGSDMGLPQVSFNWAEIGDPNDQKDLYRSGLTTVDA